MLVENTHILSRKRQSGVDFVLEPIREAISGKKCTSLKCEQL